jgi:hypothetical protein
LFVGRGGGGSEQEEQVGPEGGEEVPGDGLKAEDEEAVALEGVGVVAGVQRVLETESERILRGPVKEKRKGRKRERESERERARERESARERVRVKEPKKF